MYSIEVFYIYWYQENDFKFEYKFKGIQYKSLNILIFYQVYICFDLVRVRENWVLYFIWYIF